MGPSEKPVCDLEEGQQGDCPLGVPEVFMRLFHMHSFGNTQWTVPLLSLRTLREARLFAKLTASIGGEQVAQVFELGADGRAVVGGIHQ